MKNGKMTPLKAVFVILVMIAVLGAVLIIGARVFFRAPVKDYYKASEKAFLIPECNNGFTPQGIEYDDESDMFFVTGFMADHSASPIFLVDRESGEIEKTFYMNYEGKPLSCRAGGICVAGRYVFVAGGSDHCLYAFLYDEIMHYESGTELNSLGQFPLYLNDDDCINAAFVSATEDHVYVGEFNNDEVYPTPESHRMTSGVGDENTALVASFKISDEKDTLFSLSLKPDAVYSIPSLAQGMVFENYRVYLSTSYGPMKAYLYEYDALGLSSGTTSLLGAENIPLYYLDSTSLVSERMLPPMAEEFTFADGKMYLMSKAAANKYLFGKFTGAQYCWSTDLEKFPTE